MALTGFEDSNHSREVDEWAKTVLTGLSVRRQSNPITGKRIAEALGIGEPAVRAIVHYLRCSGHPIGSGAKGYFLATSKSELGPTIAHLEQRLRSISSVTHYLRAAADRL